MSALTGRNKAHRVSINQTRSHTQTHFGRPIHSRRDTCCHAGGLQKKRLVSTKSGYATEDANVYSWKTLFVHHMAVIPFGHGACGNR